MSANFYAWRPELKLDANSKSFVDDVEALYDKPLQPHPALQAFIAALLARYPDLMEDDDAVWAAGPLQDEILGEFVNVAVTWSRSDEVWKFFLETARAHGLVCYDPQAEKVYLP